MLSSKELRSILVSPGLVEEEDFSKAEERAKRSRKPLEEVLIEEGLVDELKLGMLVAEYYKVPFVNLREKVLDPNIVRHIPETLARNKRLILYDIRDGKGYLAMVDPRDPEGINAISRSLGMPLEVAYATNRAIGEALRYYQHGLHEEFGRMIGEGVSLICKTPDCASEDLPVVRIVDAIVRHAYQSRASDIHLEPLEEEVAVRFRIDGVLNDIITIPERIYDLIVARIKVLSHLRTDEHFAAQDGKFRIDVKEEQLDVRVSIIPTTHGEKVVMRLLSKKLRTFTLEDLGFSKEDLKKIREAIVRPHGMILATGPTGSGKTTTLYAILKKLNTREVNITTIEDPVEYALDGVNQIQINPRTDLTFAKGLRSILRQDPDIIMVGEIRDEETANIAVNAALTGHLVLSTLHTNDAPTTLPRLLEMGVEPFLVASSVNIAIAQRLVRRICRQCIMSVPLSESQREIIRKALPPKSHLLDDAERRTRLFRGKGCPYCNGTGFKGRIGIYEVLSLSEKIRGLIVEKASADAVKRVAREEGMTSMLEDGIVKVFQGITTVEEVLRVTQE